MEVYVIVKIMMEHMDMLVEKVDTKQERWVSWMQHKYEINIKLLYSNKNEINFDYLTYFKHKVKREKHIYVTWVTKKVILVFFKTYSRKHIKILYKYNTNI